MILGGDLNIRSATERFDLFRELQPLTLVHEACTFDKGNCDVRMSWDGDEPWLGTQDSPLFASGTKVAIRLVRVETMFDGATGSPTLSDHGGFRVIYELGWTLPALQSPCSASR